MRGALLEKVEESITRRQYAVAQYIATRSILDIYEEAVRHPGTIDGNYREITVISLW